MAEHGATAWWPPSIRDPEEPFNRPIRKAYRQSTRVGTCVDVHQFGEICDPLQELTPDCAATCLSAQVARYDLASDEARQQAFLSTAARCCHIGVVSRSIRWRWCGRNYAALAGQPRQEAASRSGKI